jgi:exodeoxyribonuclease VII small subunit
LKKSRALLAQVSTGLSVFHAPSTCGLDRVHCQTHQGLRPKIGIFVPEHPMPKAASTDSVDAPAAPLPATYEAALAELESLVGQLESGQMPLDQLLTGYQRGAALLAFCRDKLKAVEDQIQVLDGGQLKPWSGA